MTSEEAKIRSLTRSGNSQLIVVELNDEEVERLAEGFWEEKYPKESRRELVIENFKDLIEKAFNRGFLARSFSPSKLSTDDIRMMAALKQLAKEMGYELGNFYYNPRSWGANAIIQKAKEKTLDEEVKIIEQEPSIEQPMRKRPGGPLMMRYLGSKRAEVIDENRISKDNKEYQDLQDAGKYWDSMGADSRIKMKKDMQKLVIANAKEDKCEINLKNTERDPEKISQKMAAFRLIAKEMGYSVSEFEIDLTKGTIVYSVNQAKEQVQDKINTNISAHNMMNKVKGHDSLILQR